MRRAFPFLHLCRSLRAPRRGGRWRTTWPIRSRAPASPRCCCIETSGASDTPSSRGDVHVECEREVEAYDRLHSQQHHSRQPLHNRPFPSRLLDNFVFFLLLLLLCLRLPSPSVRLVVPNQILSRGLFSSFSVCQPVDRRTTAVPRGILHLQPRRTPRRPSDTRRRRQCMMADGP